MTDATGGSPSDQPNRRPALSHFREWFADPSNRTKCFETRKRVKVETHEFISKSAIRTFFTPRCTQSILDELLSREVPVRQSLVRERCLIGFCILLSIGHGKYVGELSKHHDLRDGNLPFQGPPKHLPPNVWEEFMKAQWLFTPAEFRRGIDTHPKEMRLPYLDKEFIGEGVSARLYKVTVHHDYDVDLRGSQHPSDTPPSENRVYALKVYKREDAWKDYHTETGNFERLCSFEDGHKSPPGLIGYFGAYQHGGTFNMLLEYGEGGSLHDFLSQNHPPTTGEPIHDLWSRLLEMLKGLSRIHDLDKPNDNQELSPRYQGTHHDIRPENIILVRDQSNLDADPSEASKYQFKLADLGNGQFIKRGYGYELRDLAVMDGRGGRNYGSPESCRASDFNNRAFLRVTPKTDIFSLGCVYLTVAVWMVHGPRGLDDFYRERNEENRQIRHLEADYRFHNGNPGAPKLLEVVASRFTSLPPELRRTDCTTGKVLKKLIRRMLIPGFEARPSAHELCHDMADMMLKAKENLDAGMHRRSSVASQEPVGTTPINRNTLTSQATLRASAGALDEQLIHQPFAPIYSDRGLVISPRSTLRVDTTLPPQEVGAFASSPTLSRPPVMNSGAAPSGSVSQSDHHNVAEPCHYEHRGPSMRRRGENGVQPRTSPNFDHRPTYGARQAADTTTPSSVDLETRSASLIAGDPDVPATPTRVGVQRPDSVLSSPPSMTPQRKRASTIPSAMVREVLDWKRQRKRWSGLGKYVKRDELPGGEYCKRWLHQRDHFFLIDDSRSMARHWRHVHDTFEALSYIVKECDPDGFDVEFTCSKLRYHGKTTGNIVEKVANHTKTRTGNADIKQRLLAILRPKLSELKDVDSRRSYRPISIYILTDGAWTGNNDAKTPILEAIEVLRANGLHRSTIGISFISFDDGADVPENLSELDELGNSDGRDIDIVDTTRFDGNVWKMLVGAIDDYYDRS